MKSNWKVVILLLVGLAVFGLVSNVVNNSSRIYSAIMLYYSLEPKVVFGYHPTTQMETRWLQYPVQVARMDTTWALGVVRRHALSWCGENNRELVEGFYDFGFSLGRDSVRSVCLMLKD